MAAGNRKRHFSGWQVLFVAGLAVFLSGPAQTYGVSPFVEPMLEELGWSRSLFSTAYSVGTLASAGALLLVGRQIDRWGNRLVLSLAALGFGAALLLLSVAGGAVALLVGFALLRTCGSGVLGLGTRTLVPFWFVRRRGRAFGLLGLAASLSLAAVPPVNQLLIEAVGWRTAWRIDALVVLLVLLPAVAILVRNRPEEIGQLPDGECAQDRLGSDGPDPAAEADDGLSLREASRTPAFWGLVGASAVPALVVTGLAFNQVAILTDRGLPAALAATTFAVESAIGVPTALLAGWLADRYPVRYVLAAGQLCLAVAMGWLLVSSGSPALALLYSAWRGASSGLWMVAADVAWPVYFGRRHLGSIRSAGFSVGVAGSALGPIPFGLAYDLLGGYDPAIAALLLLPLAATVAVLLAAPPPLRRAVEVG
ncbi:MAG: MFS transporter [Chloroflexota bacterium]|nr:MFS transporter [Chloroflexota bacterium]